MQPTQIEGPAPEFREERARTAVTEIGQLAAAPSAQDCRVDVLEVDVGDPLAEPSEGLDRIAAADEVVADVEADPDPRRIADRHQPVDLRRASPRRSRRGGGRPAGGPRRVPRQPARAGRPRDRRQASAANRGVFGRRRRGRPRPFPVVRAIEGDAQHVAAGIVQETQPFATDREGHRRSARKVWPAGPRRPPRAAAHAPASIVAQLRLPRGSQGPAGVPSYPSRAISSRIVAASVPSRSSSTSTLFQRIGTVPIGAASSGPLPAAKAIPQRARRRQAPGWPPRSSVLLLGDARPPALRAARGGFPGSGASHQPVLSGPATARSRSTSTWTSDGPPDARARRTAGATSSGVSGARVEPERPADRGEVGRVDRAVGRHEVGPGASARRTSAGRP